MGTDMSARTVGGLLAYCDWLREKNYQSPNAIEAWKTAVKKVFATVEPDAYESISLDQLDLDEYMRRFRISAGKQYKAETITVYERRIHNAIDAHEYYIANGRPPMFRTGGQRSGDDAASTKKAARKPTDSRSKARLDQPASAPERYEFSYPMSYGMAHISVPIRMSRRDIERLSTVLGTLEEQPQLPEHAGGQLAA